MKLAYDVYEPKSSTSFLCPIILQHSLLESKNTWRAIGQSLAQQTGRKVYAIDARNHGDSPWTDQYSYDLIVDDLNDFLLDHGIPKVILVGHSLGGKVAILFTLKNPNKVEKLVVEDVPVHNFKPRTTNLAPLAAKLGKKIIDEMKEKNSKQETERFARDVAKNFAEHLVVKPELIDSYDFGLLPLKWNGTSYDLELNFEIVAGALFNGKLQHNLSGKFEGPVLFLFGKSSPMKVDKDTLIEKFFPSATKLGFEGIGHFLHQALPEQFLEEVVRFVKQENNIQSKY